MIGHYLLLHSADFESFLVLRVDAGAIVVDLATMAEQYPKYGPRGVVFDDFAALRCYLDPDEDDDARTDAAALPSAAVH